jgi:hypothetical protein
MHSATVTAPLHARHGPETVHASPLGASCHLRVCKCITTYSIRLLSRAWGRTDASAAAAIHAMQPLQHILTCTPPWGWCLHQTVDTAWQALQCPAQMNHLSYIQDASLLNLA